MQRGCVHVETEVHPNSRSHRTPHDAVQYFFEYLHGFRLPSPLSTCSAVLSHAVPCPDCYYEHSRPRPLPGHVCSAVRHAVWVCCRLPSLLGLCALLPPWPYFCNHSVWQADTIPHRWPRPPTCWQAAGMRTTVAFLTMPSCHAVQPAPLLCTGTCASLQASSTEQRVANAPCGPTTLLSCRALLHHINPAFQSNRLYCHCCWPPASLRVSAAPGVASAALVRALTTTSPPTP